VQRRREVVMEGEETAAELQQKLSEYREQLREVEGLLDAEPGNEEYLQIKNDLVDVIDLTEDLLKLKLAEEGHTAQPGSPDSPPSNTVLPFTTAPMTSLTSSSMFTVGTACEAKFSEDNVWYKATINAVLEGGKYHVTYTEYGNSEEVPVTDIRPLTEPSKKKILPLKRPIVPDAIQQIPKSLQILPTDSEEVRAAKKKKIKAIKSANRLKEKDDEGKMKKNAWQKFQKNPPRHVPMSLSSKKKESIFKSPDQGGKIGVTGSGKPMTQSATPKDMFKIGNVASKKAEIYMPNNETSEEYR
jgi:survival-of-motor-neuron-related-splicing factor 30